MAVEGGCGWWVVVVGLAVGFGGVEGGGCSGGGGVECGDPHDVVDGAGEQPPGPVSLSVSVAEFAATGDGLDPSEGFLDPLADR
jgi:hypothetical protein